MASYSILIHKISSRPKTVESKTWSDGDHELLMYKFQVKLKKQKASFYDTILKHLLFSSKTSGISLKSWNSLIENQNNYGTDLKGLRMNAKINCRKWRNRGKKIGCQNKPWKFTREEKPKPRKTKIWEGNLKSFREQY